MESNELAKEIIKSRGELSRNKAAKQLGVHINTYRNYEVGERIPPDDFLVKLHEQLSGDLAALRNLRRQALKEKELDKNQYIHEHPEDYKKDSIKELMARYNSLEEELKNICNELDFSPSLTLRETIKSLIFSNDISLKGVVVLIKALKIHSKQEKNQ